MGTLESVRADKIEAQIAREMKRAALGGAIPEWQRRQQQRALRKRLRAARKLRTR